MTYRTLFLLTLIYFGYVHGLAGKSVDTPSAGTIVGTSKTVVTVAGETVKVDAYLGIPYAKPPIGDLRFQKPEPTEKFGTPFEAFQYGSSCPQIKVHPFPVPDVMSEDCLFLNVFVPDRPTDEPTGRAVMVWIHGGALAIGNSDIYGGSSFAASGDVIVVSINYRLNMLGFFSTGDEYAPGNMGFWDQRLALQWVQKNIEAFGGDTSRVTIFGESAGGISVSLQAMYPKNVGLFKRVIPQSGAPTTMPITTTEQARESAMQIGRLLQCTTDSTEKLVECMRKRTYQEFLDLMQDLHLDPEAMMKVILSTTVDGDFVKIHPSLLTKEANKGPVDIVDFFRTIDSLSGCNSREGSLLASYMLYKDDPEGYKPSRDTIMDELIPILAYTGHAYPPVLNDMILSEYTDWTQPDDPLKFRHEVINLIGDSMFDIPTIEFAWLHANSTDKFNSYLYYFTSRPSWNLIPMPSWIDGANHGDDIATVLGFDEEILKLANGTVKPQDWENALSARMITYWSNFAKTGNPNKPNPVDVEWPKYKLDGQKYMEFRKDADVVGEYLNARRANFWLNTVPAVKEAISQANHDPSSPFVKSAEGSCGADGKCDGE